MQKPLRIPARIAVTVFAVSAGCTSGSTVEDIGDGCVRYRSLDDVANISCPLEAGCRQYRGPDGEVLRTICPEDGGCVRITEADADVYVEC